MHPHGNNSAIYKSEQAQRAIEERYRALLARWPVVNQQLRVATRQGETFVVACGPVDGPPLVLLHGAQTNAATFMFDAERWSRLFRVYVVDLVGEPGLSAPARPACDGDAYLTWLDDVLDELGVACASFVGVSLGGWLALHYAARRSARVDRLALLSPSGIGRQEPFLLKAAPLLLLGPWGVRKVRELVVGKPPQPVPDAARPLLDFLALVAQGTRPRPMKLPLVDDDTLRAMRTPLLVIAGGRDVLVDAAETERRLARLQPQADVRLLPDSPHVIRGQTDAIFAFLARDVRARHTRRQPPCVDSAGVSSALDTGA